MTERVIVHKRPAFNWTGPDWWHHHGIKMLLRPEESTSQHLVIRGSAAELHLTSSALLKQELIISSPLWRAWWKVRQSPNEWSEGRVLMGLDTVRAAFGFDDSSTPDSVWLIERYGGEAAAQGQFIRWKRYLNIPGPGTGNDGDPNISIELDKRIQQAVINLVLADLHPREKRLWYVKEAAKEDLAAGFVPRERTDNT